MKISVIIATRNRPELLPRSLRSVAMQSYRDFELIVVDDSSTDEYRATNRALVEEICPFGRHAIIPKEMNGRGPGFPRNHGISLAQGEYIAYLDDDDEWIDPENLATVAAIVERHGLDLHLTDQEAMLNSGAVYPPPVWTEDLGQLLPRAGLVPVDGTYLAPVEKALLSLGFGHLNTLLFRRSLVADVLGGFDLRITYEEDREIYFRLLDHAQAIGYTPRLVARHHIPKGVDRPSASNTVPDEEKDASRLRYFENLVESARLEPVRDRARLERLYTLKRIAMRSARKGDLAEARHYGAVALRSRFGFKWAGYMAWLWARGLVGPRKPAV